jgi:hypothetical protein
MSFEITTSKAQTLVTWWDLKEQIDLNPVYQRKGSIWSLKQKQDLVDTALNGFDIPKFYFADFSYLNSDLNPNKKKYAVVDGKQRITTIFDFFENKFSLADTFVLYEDPDLPLAGLNYAQLAQKHPRIARRFDNYNISVMNIVTDDEQKINELFLRLNASRPLVGAEIRNAMQGEVPILIRELAAHAFWTRTRFGTKRGQDRNAAAKLLLLEHVGTFVDTKKKQLDNLVTRTNASADEHGDDIEIDEATAEAEADQTVEDLLDAAESSEAETIDVRRASERVKRHLDRMVPCFEERDPVLAQQAQIPVVYWLARELGSVSLEYLQPFLKAFETERRENRLLPTGERKAHFLEYELMARTSNDQASIGGRYKILRRLYDEFVSQQTLAS